MVRLGFGSRAAEAWLGWGMLVAVKRQGWGGGKGCEERKEHESKMAGGV